MFVTIKDIAELAGVSRGTVDRVLNNRGNVSEKAREKVLRIAKELGYEKNVIASTLAYNRNLKIAVVLPSSNNDVFWEQPRTGIARSQSFVKHYGILIEDFEFNLLDKQDFCSSFERAIASEPNAILLAPIFLEESLRYIQIAQQNDIPIIAINTELEHDDILVFIGQNSYQCGYLAGRLFKMTINPGDEIATITFGHHAKNAKHIIDKIKGLENYFHDNFDFKVPVRWLELVNFDDPQALLQFYESLIKSNPNIKHLFFTNSRAYKLLNLIDPSELTDYRIIGFDLIEPNIQLLRSGVIEFLINQNPSKQGYMGIINIVNHFILNKEITKKQYTPSDIIMKENIDFYLDQMDSDLALII